ncbi:expressed unknown protein [Seminavis robusta]|uniref:Uncharacterized protein n=1 Tax=Seminavis robusta TaxID=568900 RepID=A0A9N8DBD2_9STRA|nr:expressed unknown protein [Seminavis robusta]|eukprot:Sro7_g005940.1 n/a (1497) ;mRNA; f:94380-98870
MKNRNKEQKPQEQKQRPVTKRCVACQRCKDKSGFYQKQWKKENSTGYCQPCWEDFILRKQQGIRADVIGPVDSSTSPTSTATSRSSLHVKIPDLPSPEPEAELDTTSTSTCTLKPEAGADSVSTRRSKHKTTRSYKDKPSHGQANDNLSLSPATFSSDKSLSEPDVASNDIVVSGSDVVPVNQQDKTALLVEKPKNKQNTKRCRDCGIPKHQVDFYPTEWSRLSGAGFCKPCWYKANHIIVPLSMTTQQDHDKPATVMTGPPGPTRDQPVISDATNRIRTNKKAINRKQPTMNTGPPSDSPKDNHSSFASADPQGNTTISNESRKRGDTRRDDDEFPRPTSRTSLQSSHQGLDNASTTSQTISQKDNPKTTSNLGTPPKNRNKHPREMSTSDNPQKEMTHDNAHPETMNQKVTEATRRRRASTLQKNVARRRDTDDIGDNRTNNLAMEADNEATTTLGNKKPPPSTNVSRATSSKTSNDLKSSSNNNKRHPSGTVGGGNYKSHDTTYDNDLDSDHDHDDSGDKNGTSSTCAQQVKQTSGNRIPRKQPQTLTVRGGGRDKTKGRVTVIRARSVKDKGNGTIRINDFIKEPSTSRHTGKGNRLIDPRGIGNAKRNETENERGRIQECSPKEDQPSRSQAAKSNDRHAKNQQHLQNGTSHSEQVVDKLSTNGTRNDVETTTNPPSTSHDPATRETRRIENECSRVNKQHENNTNRNGKKSVSRNEEKVTTVIRKRDSGNTNGVPTCRRKPEASFSSSRPSNDKDSSENPNTGSNLIGPSSCQKEDESLPTTMSPCRKDNARAVLRPSSSCKGRHPETEFDETQWELSIHGNGRCKTCPPVNDNGKNSDHAKNLGMRNTNCKAKDILLSSQSGKSNTVGHDNQLIVFEKKDTNKETNKASEQGNKTISCPGKISEKVPVVHPTDKLRPCKKCHQSLHKTGFNKKQWSLALFGYGKCTQCPEDTKLCYGCNRERNCGCFSPSQWDLPSGQSSCKKCENIQSLETRYSSVVYSGTCRPLAVPMKIDKTEQAINNLCVVTSDTANNEHDLLAEKVPIHSKNGKRKGRSCDNEQNSNESCDKQIGARSPEKKKVKHDKANVRIESSSDGAATTTSDEAEWSHTTEERTVNGTGDPIMKKCQGCGASKSHIGFAEKQWELATGLGICVVCENPTSKRKREQPPAVTGQPSKKKAKISYKQFEKRCAKCRSSNGVPGTWHDDSTCKACVEAKYFGAPGIPYQRFKAYGIDEWKQFDGKDDPFLVGTYHPIYYSSSRLVPDHEMEDVSRGGLRGCMKLSLTSSGDTSTALAGEFELDYTGNDSLFQASRPCGSLVDSKAFLDTANESIDNLHDNPTSKTLVLNRKIGLDPTWFRSLDKTALSRDTKTYCSAKLRVVGGSKPYALGLEFDQLPAALHAFTPTYGGEQPEDLGHALAMLSKYRNGRNSWIHKHLGWPDKVASLIRSFMAPEPVMLIKPGDLVLEVEESPEREWTKTFIFRKSCIIEIMD